MKLKGQEFKISQLIFLAIYYGFAQFLPDSYSLVWGG